MYSKNYSFQSAVYGGFFSSKIKKDIALHPEQINVLNLLKKEKAIILSAPTSFGKTFIIFEYIVRNKPENVVIVVPTLALVDEYKIKILREYKDSFSEYKVFTHINLEKDYSKTKYKIFILTHDKVVIDYKVASIFKEIDFLVIDEVYKLKKDVSNERILILNLAYKFLMEKAKKHVLLSPFLKNIVNVDKLPIQPELISTDFSAVVNEVKVYPVKNNDERINKTIEIMDKEKNSKTLVYFPSITKLNNFVKKCEWSNPANEMNKFADLLSREVHDEWNVVKCLRKGIMVHHGQIPLPFRIVLLELFNNKNFCNLMLCTSTLSEGVNTKCKNIIITEPKVEKQNLDTFDFFNLVGRSGRMGEYYLGIGHYIKGPKDPNYSKDMALKSIEFELTSDSIDMKINSANYKESKEYLLFLSELNIEHNDYLQNIASKIRFQTTKSMYNRFKQNLIKLKDELKTLSGEEKKSKYKLVEILFKIINEKNRNYKLCSYIIHKLTYKKYLSVKEIVDSCNFKKVNVDERINTTLRMRNSFLEHEFYKRVQIVIYFLELEGIDSKYIELIRDKILSPIESKYFMNNEVKKTLKDLGIYEKDIDTINKFLNLSQNFSVNELLEEIKNNMQRINKSDDITPITKFVIKRFTK
ncbi:DEAD/DEAH box helicase [Mycoplasma yeatsii]|uniref:DEAD/DEAH box helicase n=1 Tax=Mycoplasma yeatsii TaxID=51365 RepID=UPI00130DC0C2|nr:DEAD/DEAH box helicase [Mycoplasma yeatsii]